MKGFISLSCTGEPLVREVATVLQNSGLEIWDGEREIFPGDNWAEKIGQALREAVAMVVLSTPNILNSSWVKRDIQYRQKIGLTMAIDITLTLPDNLVEHAQRFGQVTQRDVKSVLAEALEMMWPTLGNLPNTEIYPPVTSLSDAEVLALASAKMDAIQNQRLGALQEKGKASGLTMEERYELMALMQIYQIGQLRKSEGMAEAVRRGLQPPLSA